MASTTVGGGAVAVAGVRLGLGGGQLVCAQHRLHGRNLGHHADLGDVEGGRGGPGGQGVHARVERPERPPEPVDPPIASETADPGPPPALCRVQACPV